MQRCMPPCNYNAFVNHTNKYPFSRCCFSPYYDPSFLALDRMIIWLSALADLLLRRLNVLWMKMSKTDLLYVLCSLYIRSEEKVMHRALASCREGWIHSAFGLDRKPHTGGPGSVSPGLSTPTVIRDHSL